MAAPGAAPRGRLARCLVAASLALLVNASAAQALTVSVDDGHTYMAAFQDVTCKSDVVLQPGSTQEVADAIKAQAAAAAAAGRALKVRATHKAFHSTATFPCPGGSWSIFPSGAGAAPLLATLHAPLPPDNVTSVTLLQDGMRRVLAVDHEAHTVRAQAGMLVSQLLREAEALNMSLPLGSVPAFGDLTLGGVLVTGAHGSGHKAISSLGDILLEVTWVDGQGEVHVDARNSTAGRALVGGLGVAGMVTELLLQLTPPSHTQLSTRFKRPDADLVADDKLPLVGLPVWAAIQETSVGHAMANLHNGRRMFEGVGDTNHMQARRGAAPAPHCRRRARPLQRRPRGHARRRPVTHTRTHAQSVSCGDKCLWNMGSKIAMEDIHMSVELDQLADWVADVKAIVDADLFEGGARARRRLSPGYFWLRFGSGSADFLGHTSGMTAPVHVQMSFMKSMANPLQPNKHGWVLEAIEQLTLCKYKGKPHWGKNKPRTFVHPTCHVADHLPLWGDAAAFRAGSDPARVFEPQLFVDMAARAPPRLSPGCSPRGECFCVESLHCAPGFVCVPSAAFPEYNVCKLPAH
ncbi:GULLO2 [Scenedesmus sp. PABB004]|nr:GULLO2 [Scenedesmus sp. PABB004]